MEDEREVLQHSQVEQDMLTAEEARIARRNSEVMGIIDARMGIG